MAKNWKEAQINEVKFWNDIYLKNSSDRVYKRANDQELIGFTNEVLEQTKLVLVDFWAEWCGPCKQIAPTLEELAEKYSENLSVCKVDVDANRELALQYNVRSIPSLMIFKNGEMVDSLIGAVSLEELEDLVTRNF